MANQWGMNDKEAVFNYLKYNTIKGETVTNADDISFYTDIPISRVASTLKRLWQAGLIASRKVSKNTYAYRIIKDYRYE